MIWRGNRCVRACRCVPLSWPYALVWIALCGTRRAATADGSRMVIRRPLGPQTWEWAFRWSVVAQAPCAQAVDVWVVRPRAGRVVWSANVLKCSPQYDADLPRTVANGDVWRRAEAMARRLLGCLNMGERFA